MYVPAVDLLEVANINHMTIEQTQAILARALKAMTTEMKRISVKDSGKVHWYSVERVGVGKITTPFGTFWQYAFDVNDAWEHYNVILKAPELDENFLPVFKDREHLVIRIDSGCGTGQLFHDLSCDCRQQLEQAMAKIEEAGEGIIVHIPRQDGRGMSIGFKLSTLTLQEDLGVNTVESASMLAPGGVIDVRTYAGVVAIIQFLGIPMSTKIDLATNNPKKAIIFEDNGYEIEKMIPVVIEPTKHTIRHLRAKQEHMGHMNLVRDNDQEDVA